MTTCTAETFISSKTNPAPFISTLFARDVVAAIKFLRIDLALWTIFSVIVFCPAFKLLITHVSTPNSPMGSLSTFHANFLTTLAICCFSPPSSLPYIIHTAWPWTPTQVWVKIHINVHLEPDILFEDLLWPKSFDIHLLEINFASMLHARDFQD
jgi:hypothetical protein